MRYNQLIEISLLSENDIPLHQQYNPLLLYVLEGKLQVGVQQVTSFLKTEDIFLVNSNTPFNIHKDQSALVATFTFSYKDIIAFTQNPTIYFDLKNEQQKSDDYLHHSLKEALMHHMRAGSLERIREANCCYNILWCLVKNYSLQKSEEIQHNNRDKLDRIDEITEFIQMNYDKQISLQDLSRKMYLSISYLSKYIKNKLGKGFEDYVREVRMSYASEDLLSTDHSVTRIALENGFPNLASFNRAFQLTYALTPTQYRKSVQKKAPSKEAQDGSTKLVQLQKYFLNNPLDIQRERDELIIVDARQYETYVQNWTEMLNLGPAADLLKSDVQIHIVYLKKNLNFKYGRIWNIFSKEICIDITGKHGFNFSNLDHVLSFLIQNGIVPFLNFGFKPRRIVKNVKEVIVISDNTASFSGPQQYCRLIENFMRHCIFKFGLDQVNNWKLEFWWDQTLNDVTMDPMWQNLFSILYHTAKTYAPDIQVGGYGFNIYDRNRRLEAYLQNWQNQTAPDFLSVFLYPYEINPQTENQDISISEEDIDEDFMKKELTEINGLMEKYHFPSDQLYVTEWNSSISERNYLHDSCYMGAYIIKNICSAIGLTRCFSYWGSTDKLSEYFDSGKFLFGAPGLLSKDGLRKPSFFAFKFLSRLGKMLIRKNDNYIITTDGHDNYFIVCHNYVNPNLDYYYNKKENIACDKLNMFFKDEQLHLTFKIANARIGEYVIRRYWVNQNAGSVMDEMLRTGNIEYVDSEAIEYLPAVSVPHQMIETIPAHNGALQLQTSMEANEIQLICLLYYGSVEKP